MEYIIMTISEAIRIIKSENLTHFNLYEQRPYRERELTLQHIDGKWNVFMTDERACIFPPSEIIFDNESDALDDFIRRLRIGKRLELLSGGKYW